MTAASTLDTLAVAYAQQMIEENQLFYVIQEKMKDRSLNSIYTLLRLPMEYDLIMKQPCYSMKLPMSDGMKDVLFTDEETGTLALKNGDELLYVSLYWRANYAVNSLARVHLITPQEDRVATIFEDVKFIPSGQFYVRPERNNLFFSDDRNYYPHILSAHTGEKLPIAKIPEEIPYKLGDENAYAGKGDFYILQYGKYLIGMNCSSDKDFQLELPKKKRIQEFPGKREVKVDSVLVKPRTTVVFIID